MPCGDLDSQLAVTAQNDEFKSMFSQETQYVASMLTAKLVQCIYRNINCVQVGRSVHTFGTDLYMVIDCTHSLSLLLAIERLVRARCATRGCASRSLQSLNYCGREKKGTGAVYMVMGATLTNWSDVESDVPAVSFARSLIGLLVLFLPGFAIPVAGNGTRNSRWTSWNSQFSSSRSPGFPLPVRTPDVPIPPKWNANSAAAAAAAV